MRLRIVCLSLLLALVLPLALAGCSKETEPENNPAKVFTLYCITEKTTTPEAITRVEYEINRTLFYRIGSMLKLELVTADEYQELIQQKKEEVMQYSTAVSSGASGNTSSATSSAASDTSSAVSSTSSEASSAASSAVSSAASSEASAETSSGSSGRKTLSNTAKLSDHAIESGYDVMTGEAILNDLNEGIEIELETPRLDLFLITDYDSYLKMAEDGDLAALDTVLNNEAKAIKEYVHTAFFNAAKVGNKTYGVPCNTTIGEYTYIVFDKDVLEASGVAQETLYTLEDLADYLAIVKENNPDVVPLANAITPSSMSFMFEDGFPAYVNNAGFVVSTYEDDTFNQYLTMLTRYSALGYFQNASGQTGKDENAKFAVKFIPATKQEMADLAAKNNYVYNRYSVPVATSENSIDCIYALSAYCPTSWQTDAMEVLTELYTDINLQNLFLYGVEDENYRVEGNQVFRLNDEYMMNPAYTGNCFIAYTDGDAGDPLTKWSDAREQNVDAVQSKTIGFTYEPTKYDFKQIKDGKVEDITLSEPDYEEILWNIIQPHYDALLDGTAIEFDYQTAYEEADAAARESIRTDLLATYEKRLQNRYTSGLAETVETEQGEQIRADAEALAKEQLVSDFDTNSRRRRLKEKLQEENPDASDDDLTAMLEQLLTEPDRLWENYRTVVRSEEQWADVIDENYNDLLDQRIEEETDKILASSAYQNDLKAIPTSEAFLEDYEYGLNVEVADTVTANLDQAISTLIDEYADSVIAECEEALQKAIDEFVEEYVEAAKVSLEAAVRQQVPIDFRADNLSEEETEQHISDIYNLIIDTEGVIKDFTTGAKDLYEQYYGTQYDDATGLAEFNTKFEKLEKSYKEIYLPLYAAIYNGENQALVDIGYLSRDVLTVFSTLTDEEQEESGGTTSESTSSEATSSGDTSGDGGEGGEEDPTPGNYNSYYEFVFIVKLRAPYYAQFGEPGS